MASNSIRPLRSAEDTHPLQELTSRIIACCIEVHRILGPGFEEVFYQRALLRELDGAGLDAGREINVPVHYKGVFIGNKRVDFVISECMLEIKAKQFLEDVDKVQTLSYLKASGLQVALLANFGAKKIEIVRIVNTRGGNPEA